MIRTDLCERLGIDTVNPQTGRFVLLVGDQISASASAARSPHRSRVPAGDMDATDSNTPTLSSRPQLEHERSTDDGPRIVRELL